MKIKLLMVISSVIAITIKEMLKQWMIYKDMANRYYQGIKIKIKRMIYKEQEVNKHQYQSNHKIKRRIK